MIPPGKDTSYQQSIERMTRLVQKAGFSLSFKKKLNPANNLFSLLVCDSDDPDFFYTNGKGSSEDGAIASGLGEFLERMISRSSYTGFNPLISHINKACYHPDEVWIIPEKSKIKELMGENLFSFYYENNERDFSKDFFQGFSGQNIEGQVCCLPFSSGNEEIFVPFVLLDDLYCTNGMASGNSILEAKVQALSEIIERFVKFKIIHDEIELPIINENFLLSIPGIADIINDIKGFGGELIILDASLNGAFPVTAAALLYPDKGIRLSFGSHPCFITSLERTLTEMFQGRALKDTSADLVFPDIYHNSSSSENLISHFIDSTGELPLRIFKKGNFVQKAPFNYKGNREGELHYLQNIVSNNGFKVFYSDIELKGLFFTRIIVPGMSEVYPLEELDSKIDLNHNRFSQVLLNHLLNKNNDPLLLEKMISESYYSDFTKISEISGFMFNQKDDLQSMCIAELKIRVAASLGNSDISQLIQWYIESSEKQAVPPLIHYFNYYFNEQLDDDIVRSFFSEELILLARKIIKGQVFPEAEDITFQNRYNKNKAKFFMISDYFFNN